MTPAQSVNLCDINRLSKNKFSQPIFGKIYDTKLKTFAHGMSKNFARSNKDRSHKSVRNGIENWQERRVVINLRQGIFLGATFFTLAAVLVGNWNVFDRILARMIFGQIKGPIRQLNISHRAEKVGDGHGVRIPGEQVRPFAHRRNTKSLRTHLEKLSHGGLRASVDLFEELEGVVGVAVDDVDPDGRIDVVGERIFAHEGTRHSLKLKKLGAFQNVPHQQNTSTKWRDITTRRR